MADYVTISSDDEITHLADAFVGRELEVFHYDTNIANYSAMLAALPQGEWPAELAPYKGENPDAYPVDQIDAISNLEFRDRINSLLRTEKIERGKSALVLATLRARIPIDQFGNAVAAAKTRLTTAQTA